MPNLPSYFRELFNNDLFLDPNRGLVGCRGGRVVIAPIRQGRSPQSPPTCRVCDKPKPAPYLALSIESGVAVFGFCLKEHVEETIQVVWEIKRKTWESYYRSHTSFRINPAKIKEINRIVTRRFSQN